MRETVSLVKGKLVSNSFSVGPRHDPYRRDEFDFISHDGVKLWKLTLCGLVGCIFNDYTLQVEARDFKGGVEFDRVVELCTGQPMYFWANGIWEYKERSLLAKLGPEGYDCVCALREADEKLLSYAM